MCSRLYINVCIYIYMYIFSHQFYCHSLTDKWEVAENDVQWFVQPRCRKWRETLLEFYSSNIEMVPRDSGTKTDRMRIVVVCYLRNGAT